MNEHTSTETQEETSLIHTVQRIGTPENNEGWFLINEAVQVRYIDSEDKFGGMTMDIDYNDKDITEKEAIALAEELLKQTMHMFKEES